LKDVRPIAAYQRLAVDVHVGHEYIVKDYAQQNGTRDIAEEVQRCQIIVIWQ